MFLSPKFVLRFF